MLKRYPKPVLYGLLVVVVLVGVGCKAQVIQSPTAAAITPLVSPTLPQTVSLQPTSTSAGEYPGIDQPAQTVYPLPVDPTLAAYPAPTEALPAYPEPVEPTQQAYPDPAGSAQAAYPAPTESPVAAYPNPTQPPVAYPGPTQPSASTNTPVQATAVPSVVPGTATPMSSPIPTNTPLPTPTLIPTVFPTPDLPPPIRTELSATEPDQFNLVSGKVQLIEFFAYWCVACRSLADDIHSLEALYGNRVNFVYLDIDNPANVRFEQFLGFSYEPDFFLLDPEGKILHEWSGWVKPEDIRNAIEGALR